MPLTLIRGCQRSCVSSLTETDQPHFCDEDRLPDEVYFHKFIWDPENFVDGKLLESTFRKQELKGPPHHVSGDRMDQARREWMISTIERQFTRAVDHATIQRDKALSVRTTAAEIRSIAPRTFEVYHIPEDPNEAHCGVVNVSGNHGNAELDRLRVYLVELFEKHGVSDFDTTFPPNSVRPHSLRTSINKVCRFLAKLPRRLASLIRKEH